MNQDLKHILNVAKMVFESVRINDNSLEVHQNKLPSIARKKNIQSFLKYCWGISQAKWDSIVVVHTPCDVSAVFSRSFSGTENFRYPELQSSVVNQFAFQSDSIHSFMCGSW